MAEDGSLNAMQMARYLETIATNTGNGVLQMGQLILAIQTILPFSGSFGTLTLSAASTTTVTNSSVATNSIIIWVPTSAAAAAFNTAATALYLSARTAGTSFALTTANGGSAAGTETFIYILANPSG